MRLLAGTRSSRLMLANVLAAGVLMACGNLVTDDRTTNPPTGPIQRETAAAFFDRFPSRDYESFAEAEAASGFQIPRPAAEFSPSHKNIDLQWFPNLSAPVSRVYYDVPPAHIWVRVAVSGLFSDGTRS